MASIAISTTRKNPTSLAVGPFHDREHGDGVRLSGVQLLTTLAADSSTNPILFSTSSTATCSANQSIVSPDYLNGRLQSLALTYDRFRFRRISWEYEPTCATTQPGAMMLAFVQDGTAATIFTNNYANLTEITPSKSIPFRERGSLDYRYDGDRVWYSEFDASSTAGIRTTSQGVLLGMPNVAGLNASFGVLRFHYVIELFGNVPFLGGTAGRLSSSEKILVAEYLAKLRGSSSDGKEDKVEMKDVRPPGLDRPRTMIASGSASGCYTAASGSIPSGFSAPKLDERYVLVGSGQRQ